MTTRIKIPQTIITRARAEELLGEVATLALEERSQKTAMDRELTAIRERYEAPLVTLGKAIEEKTALLQSWAEANPSEFPKNRKSIEMLHGVLGYRTGTPKLKTQPKWTWDRVLEYLKTLGKPVAGFIRIKEELNKEAVLNSYAQDYVTDAQLKELGMRVVQEESFFVEPKLEDLDARKVQEAA